ncbi:uncharacterized protein ACBT44_005028 [Syngnathus typhle]
MTASKTLGFQLLLVLLGTVCSKPLCPNKCTSSPKFQRTHFQHVSDLGGSSVAPWELTWNFSEGREPEIIEHAVCKNCTVAHMVAKPIYIQIPVYKRIRNKPHDIWCKCPYELAVGCTCVTAQKE